MSPHPYRNSALIYACLALVVVGAALLTDGDTVQAVIVAAVVWVAATGWSWWRLRAREGAEPHDVGEER